MLTLSSAIDSTMKLLQRKYAARSIKLLKAENQVIGALQNGVQPIFSKLTWSVNVSTQSSPLQNSLSIIYLSERELRKNTEDSSINISNMDQILFLYEINNILIGWDRLFGHLQPWAFSQGNTITGSLNQNAERRPSLMIQVSKNSSRTIQEKQTKRNTLRFCRNSERLPSKSDAHKLSWLWLGC